MAGEDSDSGRWASPRTSLLVDPFEQDSLNAAADIVGTGSQAIHAVANALPTAYTASNVGTTFSFLAEDESM